MRLGLSRGIIKAMETVYVALRDEGVDVWRPVEAERISESVYRLADASVPGVEKWEFSPGSTVQCELRELSDGPALVAVSAGLALWRHCRTLAHPCVVTPAPR